MYIMNQPYLVWASQKLKKLKKINETRASEKGNLIRISGHHDMTQLSSEKHLFFRALCHYQSDDIVVYCIKTTAVKMSKTS